MDIQLRPHINMKCYILNVPGIRIRHIKSEGSGTFCIYQSRKFINKASDNMILKEGINLCNKTKQKIFF